MSIRKVCAVYFSATGTTKKIVEGIADTLAKGLKVKYKVVDFTLPSAREQPLRFAADELVIFGTPVYAGRVPNVLLKFLDKTEGQGALAVPVVVYGNRAYDDALIELRDILEEHAFHTFAAAAFVGEHSFSYTLGQSRPDSADMELVKAFAFKVADKLKKIKEDGLPEPIFVEGTPKAERAYYIPRDKKGASVDIRKVKPLTSDDCIDCRLCADVCPMGSINHENVREVVGICIKCGACVKRCPTGAKYFDDKGYLYHKHELEEKFKRRAEPQTFL